ncbi:hypothetical protein FQN49_005467 [Arthroderma sp. PD_2]|nr:hypothetical protein FQN49_005467 [Arthroderma sp. PD_2]
MDANLLKSPDEVYLTYHDTSLTYEDVHTLKDDWLTDNVIAFWEEYLEHDLLSKYDTRIILLRPSMSFLLFQTPDPHTLKSALPDFTNASHIFMPINDCRNVMEAEGGTHWSLLLVSLSDGLAFHYDSLPPGNATEANEVTAKISKLCDKPIKYVHMRDSPTQENSSDCGVFVCMTMRYLLRHRLLQANSAEYVTMALDGVPLHASTARKEMLQIIHRLKREGDRRRSYVTSHVTPIVPRSTVAPRSIITPHSRIAPVAPAAPTALKAPVASLEANYHKSEDETMWRPRNQSVFSVKSRSFSTSTIKYRQNRIQASYYRGGTSRGLIFKQKDLPASRDDWKPIFLGALGSPDPSGRQLDGLGGGLSSLSKVGVVSPASEQSRAQGAQVDFTFVQVGIKSTDIDYSGNCGNLTSAIGPFAIDSGLIKLSKEDVKRDVNTATVRIYNTNTQKIIDSTFPISASSDGTIEAEADGEFSIDGVAGTSSKIQLDFINPSGAKTGKLLPTGNLIDTFNDVRATCIDVGNPMIFVPASDLSIDGKISPDQISATPGLLGRLESIRTQAAIKMGMAKTAEEVPASIPKINIISAADQEGVDITVRTISVGQPHKALPITAGLSLAVATKLEGSVVREYVSTGGGSSEGVIIGHPGGTLAVNAEFKNGDSRVVDKATVYRTARRLMDGLVYWK